jgi:hypothetical protein
MLRKQTEAGPTPGLFLVCPKHLPQEPASISAVILLIGPSQAA